MYQKLEYICPKGHRGNIKWNSWQQGRRCRKCAILQQSIRQRTDYNYIKEQFEKEGYILLSKEYKNYSQKLKYICPKGHKGTIRWGDFRKGHRCAVCYHERIVGKNNCRWKGGVTKLDIPLYDTYAHQIDWCEEVRRDPDNTDHLQVRCTESGCRKWFTPTIKQVCHRIDFLNGRSTSEGRFYCSDECKQICSIYRRVKYPKGFKHNYSREVQSELRELVLKRDNYECQRCGSRENLQAHHYESIYSNPVMSADLDNCVTLCKNCHKLAHKDDGCRLVDLKRKSLCK